VQSKRARKCLQGVANYRATAAGEPPHVNTWVRVVSKGRRAVDRAASSTAALVTAVTVEDGVGSATVIYPNPLVLIHGFSGPAVKRVLVPFERIRSYIGNDVVELKKLEEELFRGVRTTAKVAVKADSQSRPEQQTSTPQCAEPAVSQGPAPVKAAAGLAADSRRRIFEFTVAVSRAFQKSKEDHISKAQLMSEVGEQDFDVLIAKLDEVNEVCIIDDVVFRLHY